MNLYCDHENAKQGFHPPARLQTANGDIPIQNKQEGLHNFDNRRQTPPTDPGSSTSQDVRCMDGVTESHHDESMPFQMDDREEQGQWPPHTNAITYEMGSFDDEVSHKASTSAVITRAMRGNVEAEKNIKDQEEYSSNEGPNLLDLDRVARVARRAIRELEKENVILQDRERLNVIHDSKGCEMKA